YSVFLNLTVVRGINDFDRRPFPMTYLGANASSNNTKTGSWFVANQTLGNSIYGYAFSVTDHRSNWTYAGPDLGPVTSSGWTFYGFFLSIDALSQVTILAVITYFAILFLWWYTARQREARTKALARSAEKSKETSTEDSKASAKPANSIAEELAKKQREISVSEFFQRNKQILGYDSATKALLTAVKEGVDNSLDAAADADILPEIFVEVRKVDKDEFLIVVEDN